MNHIRFRRAATVAAAFAFAAAPAAAQSATGPVRVAVLDAARLPARVVLVRVDALPASAELRTDADLNAELARQLEPSKPHLYLSAPLSVAMGFAGAVLGYGAGYVLLDCSDEGSDCGSGPDNGEYYLGATGLALGAATGAHLGGLRRDSRGSFALSLLGAAAGALPIVLADKEGDVDTPALISLAAAPAGAVLMDYLNRRPRH